MSLAFEVRYKFGVRVKAFRATVSYKMFMSYVGLAESGTDYKYIGMGI